MNMQGGTCDDLCRRSLRSGRNFLKGFALTALLSVAGGCATVSYLSAPRDAADAMVCGECGGEGKVEAMCRVCGGQGYITTSTPGLYGPTYATAPCRACLKSEALDKKEKVLCPRCKGTGRVNRCDSAGNRLPNEVGK